MNTTKAYATKSATVSSTAKAISHADFSWGASDLADARRAYISPFSDAVVACWSGETPTATLGHKVDVGGTLVVNGNANINALQFIRAGSSDVTLSITLEK